MCASSSPLCAPLFSLSPHLPASSSFVSLAHVGQPCPTSARAISPLITYAVAHRACPLLQMRLSFFFVCSSFQRPWIRCMSRGATVDPFKGLHSAFASPSALSCFTLFSFPPTASTLWTEDTEKRGTQRPCRWSRTNIQWYASRYYPQRQLFTLPRVAFHRPSDATLSLHPERFNRAGEA